MQSKLHLVIWNRFDKSEHAKMMKTFQRLAKKTWISGVLLMLRPLGRPPEVYFRFWYDKTFQVVDGLEFLQSPPILLGGRTGHCEMWIQVPDDLEGTFKDWLIMECDGIHFWNHRSPVWQPLSEDLYDCQYARLRKENKTKFADRGSNHAFYMKSIWDHGTRVVLKSDPLRGLLKPLQPKRDWRAFKNIMTEICNRKELVDLTEYAVSHLPCFAINALVEPWGDNKAFIEDFYDSGYVTRPHLFPSFEKFIKHINGRKFKMPLHRKDSSKSPKAKPGQGKKKPAPRPSTKKK